MMPLVSIACITYNHNKYIRDAIEGFLMQKTDFPIEILIHDDASTDGTVQIIKEYALKYPDLIIPILQQENQYSKGTRRIFQTFVFPKARGKYIALCEGDDYWTDPLKLQKQVDFLNMNPDYVMCFHNVQIVFDDQSRAPYLRENKPWDTFTQSDVISTNFLLGKNATPGHTSSVVFRRENVQNLPSWYHDFISGDIPLFVYLSGFGLSKYINKNMGVHMIHSDGVSQKEIGMELWEYHLKLYDEIDKYYRFKYHKIIRKIIPRIYVRMADQSKSFIWVMRTAITDFSALFYFIEKTLWYRKLKDILSEIVKLIRSKGFVNFICYLGFRIFAPGKNK